MMEIERERDCKDVSVEYTSLLSMVNIPHYCEGIVESMEIVTTISGENRAVLIISVVFYCKSLLNYYLIIATSTIWSLLA